MKLRRILAILAVIAFGQSPGSPGSSARAQGQYDAEGVALIDRVGIEEFSANKAEDCWGYVSPSGREYAIIGLSNGTGFVEITDPKNSTIVGHVPSNRRRRDVKVYRHYVYASDERSPLHVIDMSRIDEGIVVAVGERTGATHNIFINEDSGYMYHSVGGPLNIYDLLTDPERPRLVGQWPGQAHDVQVVNWTGGPYDGHEIAFVLSGWDQTLDIVDVTDKSSPALIGQSSYRRPYYTHQGWLSDDRNYFYFGDELDEVNGEPTTRTMIMDIRDLENPVPAGEFTSEFTSIDHNLYVRDGFIYEANDASGLHIFDASDPADPVWVGYFDTYPPDDGLEYVGAWSVYPFFPSGTVIVSDRDGGLFVLDVSEAIGSSCVRDPAWLCDGDVDGDGQVNPVDSGLVQSAFCSAEACTDDALCNYDVDCDGQINPVDSGIVQSLFGTCEIPRSVCP